MPERPDLRQIARDIRESLADYDREALVDILTYVFKEYVVEGSPPVLMGRADTIEDMADLSFPELMRALQTRLAQPELELFQVQDDVVLVRAGGVLNPLTTDQIPRRAPAAPAAPLPTETATDTRRASVEEATQRGRGDLAGGARGPVQAPPPRPTPSAPAPSRGLSISGRNAGAMAPPVAAPQPSPRSGAAQPSATQPAAQPAPTAPPAEEKKPDAGGEDASSIRFSLLELD